MATAIQAEGSAGVNGFLALASSIVRLSASSIHADMVRHSALFSGRLANVTSFCEAIILAACIGQLAVLSDFLERISGTQHGTILPMPPD